MRLAIIDRDTALLEMLAASGCFEEAALCGGLEQLQGFDSAVVCGTAVDHVELTAYCRTAAGSSMAGRILYLLPGGAEGEGARQLAHIASICEASGLAVIAPQANAGRTAQAIIGRLLPEAGTGRRNVAVFFGADAKVGTTMIAQCCAELLARCTGRRIGLLLLNDSPGADYFKARAATGLDEIRIKLWNHILTAEEFEQACFSEAGLSVLQGPNALLDVRHYDPDDAEAILSLASQLFDAIIVDAGHSLERGLAVGALRASGYKYLVTTQQDRSRRQFERVESQLCKPLQLASSEFLLLVNKYVAASTLYSGRQLAEQYGMILAGTVPDMEGAGWQAEFERRSLLHFGSEAFNAELMSLGRVLAGQLQLEWRSGTAGRHHWLRRLFAGRGGSA